MAEEKVVNSGHVVGEGAGEEVVVNRYLIPDCPAFAEWIVGNADLVLGYLVVGEVVVNIDYVLID